MGYRHGWKICFAASLFPTVVGLAAYVTGFVYSILINPDGPWTWLYQTYDFSFSDLINHNRSLAATYFAHVQIAWTNVFSGGVFGMALAWFALRRGEAWSWYFLLFAYCWIGINDSVAAVYLFRLTGDIVPMPLIATTIGLTGVWVSRDVLPQRNGSPSLTP